VKILDATDLENVQPMRMISCGRLFAESAILAGLETYVNLGLLLVPDSARS
jgi:hypothetical protein